MTNNSDMIIHTVYFDLHICVVLYQRCVLIFASFELSSQVHYLIFFWTNFYF